MRIIIEVDGTEAANVTIQPGAAVIASTEQIFAPATPIRTTSQPEIPASAARLGALDAGMAPAGVLANLALMSPEGVAGGILNAGLAVAASGAEPVAFSITAPAGGSEPTDAGPAPDVVASRNP